VSPIETIDRSALIIEVARMLPLCLAATGTASAGGSATLDDSTRLIHAANDDLKGFNIYTYAGTSSGDDRITSGSTTANDRVTVDPAWSSTPDTTTKYILLNPPYRIQSFFDGLNNAARYAFGAKRLLVPKTNRELITGDILFGKGQMERWTATTVPDDWDRDSNTTAVKEATEVGDDLRYAVKLTSNGSAKAEITFSVRNFFRLAGETLSLRGIIQQDTASRTSLEITDDISTNSLSTFTDTDVFVEKTVDDFVVSNNPKRLTITLSITAGGAVNAIFDNVRLILTSKALEEYEMPLGDELSKFVYLSEVWLEDDVGGGLYHTRFMNRPGRHIPDYWVDEREGTKYLILKPTGVRVGGDETHVATPDMVTVASPPADRRLRLVGQGAPKIITADDTNVELNAAYLKAYTAWYALRATPYASAEEGRELLRDLRGEWEILLSRMRTRPLAGSIAVEVT
jgi:hypothetical protein